jgi:F-type H+-transporting ATPase subunit b
MENRSEKIEGEIENAKNNLDESNRIKSDWEKKLSDAKNEGRKIVEDYKEKAGTLSDEILTKAREEAGLILERAKTDSEREKEKAREEIREQIVSLSLLAATKAIREELDEKKHHEIIKEFIEEVGI